MLMGGPSALIRWNLILLFAGALFGLLCGWEKSAPFPVGTTVPCDLTWFAAFQVILFSNLKVLVELLGGVFLFGVQSLVVLTWNAFRLGFSLFGLIEGGATILPLLIYGSPELLSFCLGASVGESLGLGLLRFLLTGRPYPFWAEAAVIAFLSVILLIAGAILEAGFIFLAADGGIQFS